MGYTQKVDIETKKEALQLLVNKGILTQRDFSACVKAIKSFYTPKNKSNKNTIFEDEFFSVTYKGYEEQQMLAGKGIKMFFIVENKTSTPFTLKVRKSVNGIIIDRDENMATDVPEFSKVIENTVLFYHSLKVIDVNKLDDLENISFLFRCVDKNYKEIHKVNTPVIVNLKS